MTISFNLLDQHFVPCRFADGQRELGLRETLAQSHEIKELRDTSPLVTIALHRLLLATLHRVFGPESARDWRTLWDRGSFDAKRLDKYFGDWRDRFDLFSERRPFFQDEQFKAKSLGGINQLVRELSRGNNATLFDHTDESPPPALGPAAVARALIAEQAFAIGGGKSELGYTSGGPLAGGVTVLVLGDNLFETLLLNLVRYPDDNTFVTDPEDDTPAWEREDRPVDGSQSPDGYLDYLTWLPRSIHLHPADDGSTQRMSYAQGRTYDPSRPIYDPMMPYRETDQGDRPLRLQEHKELWRDSAALFQFADTETVSGRPHVLDWLGQLMGNGHLPKTKRYSLAVIGLCTDKAKVNFWRHETLPLLPEYLAENNLVLSLKKSLELAEAVGQAVRGATAALSRAALAPGEMPADKDRVWAMVDSLAPDRIYWGRLEVPFRNFLIELPGDNSHQKQQIETWFNEVLYHSATTAFEMMADQLDHSARQLRAVVAGNRQLRISLAKISRENNITRPTKEGATV